MSASREERPEAEPSVAETGDARALVERGRAAYRQRSWDDAFVALSQAHERGPLASADLELLAWSAGLTGRMEPLLVYQEQLYELYLAQGESVAAARWAFWNGFRLINLREPARANAWLGRAERLLEREPGSVMEGYLLLPAVRQHYMARAYEQALALAQRAASIADMHRDVDLGTFARNLQGRALLRLGRIEEGLPLLDEAVIAADAGRLSPLITGLLYCSALDSYHGIYAIERAREWNGALARWCAAQPQMVTFTGACLVQRAELLEFSGDWDEALTEARRVAERASWPRGNEGANMALYRMGELYRLRGELSAAEEAFRAASQLGVEPQPGFALLRLAQGKSEQALSSLRRLVTSEADPLERLRYLPAYVEILLARGESEEAARAATDLSAIAERFSVPLICALAAESRAQVALFRSRADPRASTLSSRADPRASTCQGDAQAALTELRRAFQIYQELGASYRAARVRVALGRAYTELADADAAELERQAARTCFEKLGAASDLRALAQTESNDDGCGRAHRLTPRELHVLRLIAAGKTNKAIAFELHLSEKTVDRHVSNIFMKIGVPTRAAATAYAFQHQLVR